MKRITGGKMEKSSNNDSELEKTLWKAATALRGNMDAAEYKHVVLGLIFLKYISDSFSERYVTLQGEEYADAEDRDEYIADNIFWVPNEARWSYLQKHAKQPEIGKLIDDAMDFIEKDNPSLKGVLPKRYARPEPSRRYYYKAGSFYDLYSDSNKHCFKYFVYSNSESDFSQINSFIFSRILKYNSLRY